LTLYSILSSFSTDPATTEIYTLSLHDALPISLKQLGARDWAYLKAMPLTYHDREHNIVLVHGGFLPDQPWRGQPARVVTRIQNRSEEHTSELQSRENLVCRLLLEKKKKQKIAQ